LVTDWALAGSVIGEGEVVEYAGPAVDMAAEGELGSVWREEADWASCWLASSLLQHNLFDDIPINNGVRVDGVAEDVRAVADHKLTGGLQVVLS
jgi:hypothetical protein